MAQGAVTVKAALYYRSCPEELAAKAKVDVPTTTMAEVTKVVYPSAEAMEAGVAAAEEATQAEAEEPKAGPAPIVFVLVAAGALALAAVAFLLFRRRSAA
jgi:hypothetical protein